MKFSVAIAGTVLLASTVAAASPRYAQQRDEAMERRNARRANNIHGSTFHTDLATTPNPAGANSRPGGWAGAVVPGQSGVNNVKASFVVPHVKTPGGKKSSTKYGGTAWVGIDGYGSNELFQTGVTWTIENGLPGFSAWYEWVPGPYTTFAGDLALHPGDRVTVEVVAAGPTAGTASVINDSTGQSVHISLHGQPALPQRSAEWIVEDFQSGAGPVPFADYSPAVQFTECAFTDRAGTFGVPASAVVLEVGQNGNAPLTSCSVDAAANAVTCARIRHGI